MNYHYLTCKEVAEILRVKPETVMQYVRQGRLQTIRYGRKMLFPVEQFAIKQNPIMKLAHED